jgi:hypothetical protein
MEPMARGKVEAAARGDGVPEPETRSAPFTMVNYVLFAGGLLDIIIGWFLLRGGHITIAPLMLIAGYCVIIPLAIVLRKKKAA